MSDPSGGRQAAGALHSLIGELMGILGVATAEVRKAAGNPFYAGG